MRCASGEIICVSQDRHTQRRGMSGADHGGPGGGKRVVGRQVSSVWKRDSFRGHKYHVETLERCRGSEHGHRILDPEDTRERRQPSMFQKHFETFISLKKRKLAALNLRMYKASRFFLIKSTLLWGNLHTIKHSMMA